MARELFRELKGRIGDDVWDVRLIVQHEINRRVSIASIDQICADNVVSSIDEDSADSAVAARGFPDLASENLSIEKRAGGFGRRWIEVIAFAVFFVRDDAANEGLSAFFGAASSFWLLKSHRRWINRKQIVLPFW